jgi:hypothetical protein
MNNPLRYIDPTGHFVNILAGALIGAAVNVGLYMWNEAANQDGVSSSDLGDIAVAALQGAAVGGLIGSGVGASAGVSLYMAAGLGAASSLASEQVGNLITGEDYNPVTTSIDATMGGISGALTAGQSGAVANLTAGGAQVFNYGLDSWATNEPITPEGLAGSFASGVVGQYMSNSVETGMLQPRYEDFGTGVFKIVSQGSSPAEAKIVSELFTPVFLQPIESGIEEICE